MSDPFENAKKQLENVAKLIDINEADLAYLSSPKKVITVSIPVKMDDGSLRIFKGFRSQHNNDRGPFKGGIRYHPQVSESEIKAFSMWMSWKCSVADLPLGGGKGGIIVDPKELSESELERLSRGYIKLIYRDIGPDLDIPAPDVNTNSKIMDWFEDEYSKLVGQESLAMITGKSLGNGGSKGRTEATGRGGVYVLEQLAKRKDLKPEDTTIAVQGFGNVGYYFALLARELGFKIVAVSDSKGGIFEKQGLDIEKVMAHKKEKGKVQGFDSAKEIPGDEILEMDVDVLVPSALENAINEKNADSVKAKFVIEMANGPVTPEADEILNEKGIIVVPDVLANAGGVTVSYFEWLQNKQDKYWEEDEVNAKLEEKIVDAFNQSYEEMEKLGVDFRKAAYALAVRKVLEARD